MTSKSCADWCLLVEITAHEIAKLQQTWGLPDSHTSSPPTEPTATPQVPGGAAPASAPATPFTNSRSNSSSSSSAGPHSTPACPNSAPAKAGSSKEAAQLEKGRPSPIAVTAASPGTALASPAPAVGTAGEAGTANSRAQASGQQGNDPEAGAGSGTAEAGWAGPKAGQPVEKQNSNGRQQAELSQDHEQNEGQVGVSEEPAVAAILSTGEAGSRGALEQQAPTAGDVLGQRNSAAGAVEVQGQRRLLGQARGEAGVKEEEELLAEIAHVRPKAAAAARLRSQLSALRAQADEAETLQVRTLLPIRASVALKILVCQPLCKV
eukprot:1048792-Pelagomonas_calceolata.AAC.1